MVRNLPSGIEVDTSQETVQFDTDFLSHALHISAVNLIYSIP